MNHNQNRIGTWIACVLLTSLSIETSLLADSATNDVLRPNVIFILADDMGYGEIEALNPGRSKVPTPHLNALAQRGRVFTDAHSSSSVCSPTRYALLTGRYNWRTRLQSGVLTGGDEPLIAADRMTLGKLFQQQGYSTAIVGKWHLNFHYDIPPELKLAPKPKKTATRYPAPAPIGTRIPDGPITRGFDFYYGFHHARMMSSIIRDDKIVEELDIVDVLPALTNEVVSYIDDKADEAKAGKPFFLYFPLSSPHTPIVPAEAWIGKGKIGTYGDFVAQTDSSIGAVTDALRRNGLSDNTIVIFTADNGTSRAAGIKTLNQKGHYPSGGLRGSKADLWDGGHRVPFIVHWPGKVPAKSKSDQLICLSDMMATFGEMFGVQFPSNAAEDSVSFLPALFGKPVPNERTSIVHHSISGKFSIRKGAWKLLLASGSGGWSAPNDGKAIEMGWPKFQLYNLDDDLGELNNLVAANPDRVEQSIATLREMVELGRSTPGEPQSNDAEIDLFKSKPKRNQKATR